MAPRRPDHSMEWWLGSKAAFFITATLAFAIPMTIVFGMELYERGGLGVVSALVLFLVMLAGGYVAAVAMWVTWFRNRRL
jgi:hypothetical protein